VLVAAVNSDASVRGLKGPGRPVLPEHERAETLLSLEAVDRVVVYEEPTPLAVVRALRPDVLVKGADWSADDIVGRPEVEAAGGRVVRVSLVPGRSTTALVDRVRRP
jgi:D-beta-D-heptose 7-phosphate kinase/D-beta-D-heptose 1-phosphate adenosyltransferase